MNRAESLVIEAARQLVATYPPEIGSGNPEFRSYLMALSLAVRAYDRAEKGRLRDADLTDRCCPDHRYD